jgi:hypothetical protein
MSNALVKADTGIGIERKTIEFDKFIELAWKSGAYKDIQNAQQAAMKVVFGHAMGLDPATSLVSIHLIQGKPTMSANLMAGRVKQYGNGKYRYEIVKKDDKECAIQFLELIEDWTTDGKPFKRWVKPGPPEVFTIKMAEVAGLTKNDNWKKYPSNMLFARCMSNGVKTYCPEVLSGLPVYTPDELDPHLRLKMTSDGDLVPDAEVVQTTATVLEPVKVTQASPSLDKELRQLLKDTGTDEKAFLSAQFDTDAVDNLRVPEMQQAVQVLKAKAAGQKLTAAK